MTIANPDTTFEVKTEIVFCKNSAYCKKPQKPDTFETVPIDDVHRQSFSMGNLDSVGCKLSFHSLQRCQCFMLNKSLRYRA